MWTLVPYKSRNPGSEQVAIAFRQVEIPDINTGPSALGPNEIVNQAIADQDYVRRYMSQLGVGNLAQTFMPDVERYFRLRAM